MFRFILYRLIIKRAYVIIGYINIIESIIFFGNNYKTRGFMSIYTRIPSSESTLLLHTIASVILRELVANYHLVPTHLWSNYGKISPNLLSLSLSLSLSLPIFSSNIIPRFSFQHISLFPSQDLPT